NHRDVLLPKIRKQRARSLRILIEPLELRPPQQKNAAQNHLGHAFGMSLRVRKRKRRTPRAAKHHPLVDAEMFAQSLGVSDEIPSGVVLETCMRATLA